MYIDVFIYIKCLPNNYIVMVYIIKYMLYNTLLSLCDKDNYC